MVFCTHNLSIGEAKTGELGVWSQSELYRKKPYCKKKGGGVGQRGWGRKKEGRKGKKRKCDQSAKLSVIKNNLEWCYSHAPLWDNSGVFKNTDVWAFVSGHVLWSSLLIVSSVSKLKTLRTWWVTQRQVTALYDSRSEFEAYTRHNHAWCPRNPHNTCYLFKKTKCNCIYSCNPKVALCFKRDFFNMYITFLQTWTGVFFLLIFR